jgi:hypothetical protein
MATDREVLDQVMQRLRTAIERNTGTSFDADEVQVVGTLLYSLSAAMMGGPVARRACAVCGGAEHPDEYIEPWGRHEYVPAVLVPIPGAEG